MLTTTWKLNKNLFFTHCSLDDGLELSVADRTHYGTGQVVVQSAQLPLYVVRFRSKDDLAGDEVIASDEDDDFGGTEDAARPQPIHCWQSGP